MNEIRSNPYQNLRILEFTHAVMGPACGLIFADLGAEVIHIEPPSGDPTRRLKGFGTGYFPFFNRNKKSLAVDLKTDEGKNIIFSLVEDTDIIIENFGPGTMDRLGLGYQELSLLNPKLIYCSLKGFLSGPYQQRHAMDEVVQMMGGLAYMTGPPGQPLRAGSSVVDITGGMFGVIAIQYALFNRMKTGRGQKVCSALFETTAFLMGQHMAYSAITKQPVPPMPSRVSAWSVYRVFRTKESEMVFIGIISEKHWERFCIAFSRMDLFEDDRLKTNNQRISNRDWLLADLEKMILNISKEEAIDKCTDAQIPFAPIARPEDLFDDIHLNESGALLETTFQDGTITKLPKLPVEIADKEQTISNPPSIGSNTDEILRNYLGYGASEIAELKKKRIVAF